VGNRIGRARGTAGSGNGGPAFSLPWTVGQIWSMYQGPHDTTASQQNRRWTAPVATAIVHAAAD